MNFLYTLQAWLRSLQAIPNAITTFFRMTVGSVIPPQLLNTGMLRKNIKLPKNLVGNDAPEPDIPQPKREVVFYQQQLPKLLWRNAAFSQIHLVDTTSSKHTVVHIGVTIGVSQARVTLDNGVQLTFAQVNPKAHNGCSILMTFPSRYNVMADGKPSEQTARISHGTLLKIDDREYRVELYAWQPSKGAAAVEAAWLTNAGPVREYNEDAIAIYPHKQGYFFAVADGVGGGAAGEEISAFTVQSLLSTFRDNAKKSVNWGATLTKTLTEINKDVRRFGRQVASQSGSTVTAIIIQEWDATIIHLGDTRLYHWNSAQGARQVTQDHVTFTTEEEAERSRRGQHVKQNLLLKAIGKADTIEPDIMTMRLQPNDKLLLCSDGVSDRVTLAELNGWFNSVPTQRIPTLVAQRANERMNSDNISVIAIDLKPMSTRAFNWPQKKEPRVYSGYDTNWSGQRLRVANYSQTIYPSPLRQPQRWLAALVLLLVIWFTGMWTLSYLNSPAGAAARGVFTETPTPTATWLNSPTPRVTSTLMPLNDANSAPSATPPPPTSTLRPIPTSTLQR
jgi:PPM family protein phosphatase